MSRLIFNSDKQQSSWRVRKGKESVDLSQPSKARSKCPLCLHTGRNCLFLHKYLQRQNEGSVTIPYLKAKKNKFWELAHMIEAVLLEKVYT